MIKKIFIGLVLLGSFVNASSVSDYRDGERLVSKMMKKDSLSFDVNYAGLLGIVDERLEKDYLVSAPKRLTSFGSLVTLSYNF